MTKVEITLPDQLAEEARRAGLLSPESFEQWVREKLRTLRVDELYSAMDRMSLVDDPPPMSAEAVAQEIASMRAERRGKNPG